MTDDVKPVAERKKTSHLFKKGEVANPAGKPKGTLNRASRVRQELEAVLMEDLNGHARMVMLRAIEMAKNGDRQMIKLLLGKILADASVTQADEKQTGLSININVSGFNDKSNIIEAEIVEDEND